MGYFYWICAAACLRATRKLLRRMRWFFLSILILYFWFTPGQVVETTSFFASWLPTMEGLEEGLLRVGALVTIILAVSLLLQTTNRDQLLGAIYWLVGPLAFFGVSRERVSVRMTLALEGVAQAQAAISEARQNTAKQVVNVTTRFGAITGELLCQVIERAERTPPGTITLLDEKAPPLYQWLYPLCLVLTFWALD